MKPCLPGFDVTRKVPDKQNFGKTKFYGLFREPTRKTPEKPIRNTRITLRVRYCSLELQAFSKNSKRKLVAFKRSNKSFTMEDKSAFRMTEYTG